MVFSQEQVHYITSVYIFYTVLSVFNFYSRKSSLIYAGHYAYILSSAQTKDDVFAVSPDPDRHVYDVNVLKDRCLVLATDGAWNVVTPDMAVQCVSESEKSNEKHMIDPQVINNSKRW